MIGYGPGHVKALDQISMVQRVRTATHPATPPLPASIGINMRNRRPPICFLLKSLTKIRDTLYHFELAQLQRRNDLRAASPVRRHERRRKRPHERRSAPLTRFAVHSTLTQQDTTMKKFGSMLNGARRALKLSKTVAMGAAVAAAVSLSQGALAADAKIPVVAAENFYGDVVQQLGGERVDVTSILSNPDQDPHLFEASPKTARALQHASLVVYNGADYDPWMAKLLAASKGSSRTTIVAAELTGKKSGDNPHLWYDPATMPKVARAVSAALVAADPAHKSAYDANLAKFLDSLKPIDAKVADLHGRYAGVPVTATEPVFGYMSDAVGLSMRNLRFQMATMNDTEASAADIAAFERDLREKRVRVLIYNSQATEALTKRMLKLAQQSKVPTLSVTETEPAGKTYQTWMLTQLDALGTALGAADAGGANAAAATAKGKTQ
ncbi:cation ABC transporter substrate-binding protein [Paraburkholderia caffeinilytica]|nr:cation ABC transporter substrate-binding protein [Paraburkholderia caffeinilytica]